MFTFNRRRFDRKNSLNLIDYEIRGLNGGLSGRGIGRTRNISCTGVLLETSNPLEPGWTVHLTLGLENEMIGIKGRVVHMEAADEGLFWAGIEFLEMDVGGKDTLERYLKTNALRR
jgi:hypothetical protein